MYSAATCVGDRNYMADCNFVEWDDGCIGQALTLRHCRVRYDTQDIVAKVMSAVGASPAGDEARVEASLLGDMQHSLEPCRHSKYIS